LEKVKNAELSEGYRAKKVSFAIYFSKGLLGIIAFLSWAPENVSQ
jgi:hypothetical protein